jgi:hypothetical protein
VGADDRDLDVLAQGTPYFELAPAVHRRFDAGVRISVRPFARLRAGPTSYGMTGRVTFDGDGWQPRVLLTAETAMQQLDSFAWSLEGRATAVWGIKLHPYLWLHPIVGFRAIRVRDPGGGGGQSVDPDVYTRFADDHPQMLRGRILLRSRPFVGTILRLGLTVMTNRDLHTLDRAEADASVDLIPDGSYVPRFQLEYRFSYRFADPFRPRPFIRHLATARAELWRWWVERHRLSLGSELQWIADQSQIAWLLTLRYLWSPHRGTHDLPSTVSPFRERLDERAAVSDLLERPAESLATDPDD